LTLLEEDVQESNSSSLLSSPVFERKLDAATAGLHPFIREHLLSKISQENAMIIVEYVLAIKSEISLSDNYRRNNILTLKRLAESIVA
jgi:hypothetical protein